MATDAPPDDVRLAWARFWAVFEGRASILLLPGHLEDAWMPLDCLDAQARSKWLAVAQIDDHLANCFEKRLLVFGWQHIELAQELSELFMSRHRRGTPPLPGFRA